MKITFALSIGTGLAREIIKANVGRRNQNHIIRLMAHN